MLRTSHFNRPEASFYDGSLSCGFAPDIWTQLMGPRKNQSLRCFSRSGDHAYSFVPLHRSVGLNGTPTLILLGASSAPVLVVRNRFGSDRSVRVRCLKTGNCN